MQVPVEIRPSTEICPNLQDKPRCLCFYPVDPTEEENSFRCLHCKITYHTSCMRKKQSDEYCGYCHLQRMMPLKRVVHTVYVGHLKKSAFRHQAKFVMPAISATQYYQFRCLRLKEGAQASCLFPDIAEFQFNSHSVRIFNPINKLSSLKYRKDEPFRLLKSDYLVGKENQLLVSEVVGNRPKEIRYEAQNHLLGLYVVEDIKTEVLIAQIKESNVTNYYRSKALLDGCFQFGKSEEDITCELVKIPLSCPLSTERISIPVRGIFCTHFQCFDLKTYTSLISEATNPRWKCPLCNSLAYELQIDCILQAIIAQNKYQTHVKEIVFYKNGAYSERIEQPGPHSRTIEQLDIDRKREGVSLEGQGQGQPRRKPTFVLPPNAKVISLDD